MINPQLVPYGLTLANPNPLAPESLVQPPGGIAQIPTGTVETTHEPSKDYKVVGGETRAAMDAMDLAFQSKQNAADELAKADVAKEQAAADAARNQAKIAEETESKRQAMQKAEDDRRVREEADRAKALEEFEKASKTTTLFQDMTPLRRLMSAVAVGAGQWASTMGGGPNTAYQIFRDSEENHRRTQEAAIRKATERVMAQSKSAEAARKYFDDAMDRLDKTMLARSKVVDLQLAAIEKSIPQAAARAAQIRAQNAIEYEKDKRNYIGGYDTAVKEIGKTTQESSGTKSGGQQAADASTKQAVITARETARSMKDLGDFIKKNPEAWKEYQQAAQAEAELEAAKQGNEKLISSLQGFGVAKVSIDQRLTSPEARKINAMVAPMITAKAREMDPIGALNKDAYINASKSLNLFTGPPDEIAGKAYEYSDKNNRIADEYVNMTPALQSQAQSAQSTGKVGSPNRVRGIPAAKQDAAIAAVDDYMAIKGAMKAGKVKQTPNIMEAMGRVQAAHERGSNDDAAAEYLRMVREREGI